jgi:hypothetical protein
MAMGTKFLLQCAEIECADIDWVRYVLAAARYTPLKEIDTVVLLLLVRDDEDIQNMLIALVDPLTIRRVLQDHLEVMDRKERDRLYAHARLRLSTVNTPGMGQRR